MAIPHPQRFSLRVRFAPSFLIVTLLILCSTVPSVLTAQTEPLPGLDAYVQAAIDQWNVPGLALAIVKDDKVVYERGYGVRDLETKEPVDRNTIFSIASTTKAMTVACLGMLVDEGKISWDDPVTKYLPSFQVYDPWVTRELTIRDLLTHRSGLSRGDLLWYASPYDRKEVIERVRKLEPTWSFRSHYGYQNIMYITAGEVVGAASGSSWDEFIRTRLFGPLAMERSSTSISALKGVKNVATPYELEDGKLVKVTWPNYDNLGGAGAVNSSVHDMAQWVRMNLAQGMYDGKRILSEKVIREVQSAQMVQRRDSLTRALFPMSNLDAYGLGWGLQDYYGKLLVTHSGWLDGMRTRVALLPQLNVGVVVIMNGPRARLHQALALWILDRYLGAEQRDWVAIQWADLQRSDAQAAESRKKREESRIPGTSPAHSLDEYAGTYTHDMYGDMTISKEADGLRVVFGPFYRGRLEHRHFETFQVNWDEAGLGWDDLLFVPGFDGHVAAVKWGGVGEFSKKAGT